MTVTDAETGATLATLDARATLGTLTAPLAAGTMFVWDVVNAIELVLLSGHLASRDDAEVLAGANRIAVETDAGEWEMVGFADAELIAPETYPADAAAARAGRDGSCDRGDVRRQSGAAAR